MTVARHGQSAVSRGQHLIVAGGYISDSTVGDNALCYTDIVELFDLSLMVYFSVPTTETCAHEVSSVQ